MDDGQASNRENNGEVKVIRLRDRIEAKQAQAREGLEAKKKERVEFRLGFTRESWDELTSLKEDYGYKTAAEMLERALLVLCYLDTELQLGNKVVIEKRAKPFSLKWFLQLLGFKERLYYRGIFQAQEANKPK